MDTQNDISQFIGAKNKSEIIMSSDFTPMEHDHLDSSAQTPEKHLPLATYTLFITVLILFPVIQLFGQNNANQIPLWEKDQLVYPEYDYKENAISEDIIRLEKVTDPFIEVYLPAKKIRTGASVVICPGGGYRILAWDWEGQDFAKLLNSAGITAFVLKYRLPFPVNGTTDDTMPMRDAMRAIQIVRKRASEWNLDPGQIGIMGFSAGGHLASSVGVHWEDQTFLKDVSDDTTSARPDFMALIYPVIDFQDKPDTHKGSRSNLLGSDMSPAKKEYYSSHLQVTEHTPPAFMVHAQDDKGVPVENSLQMYRALREHGIDTEMHLYPYGGHGFGLAVGEGRLSKWPQLLIDWINSR